MIFRFDRFFLDEKDLFIFFFGTFLAVSHFLNFSLEPFRIGSLLVLFFFLVITRSMINAMRFEAYFFITLFGLLFSLFLSPYGTAIYLFIAMLIYLKWGRV